jgi:hypothetical protein
VKVEGPDSSVVFCLTIRTLELDTPGFFIKCKGKRGPISTLKNKRADRIHGISGGNTDGKTPGQGTTLSYGQ